MTPLYDAIGNTITKIHKLMENEENAIASVTIITDGYENASKEYSHKAIKSLIEAYKSEGWLFAYIGADHDVETVSYSLSIDNKLIKEHKGGICDCALFDDKQFRFIEFKTNAYGNSSEQVRETFDKATSQLKETIHVFKDRLQKVDIQFEDAVTLSCHVVVSQRFPKSRAIKQEYQISFADENNNIGLFFSEKTHWEKPEK
jgi:hypothetical protein